LSVITKAPFDEFHTHFDRFRLIIVDGHAFSEYRVDDTPDQERKAELVVIYRLAKFGTIA
jgi:hypothetical protein